MALDATSEEFIQLLRDARDSASHAAATAADASATAADVITATDAMNTAVAKAAEALASASASEASHQASLALYGSLVEVQAEATAAAASAQTALLEKWEAQAEKMTAESFSSEAEDVFVSTYTSNGDGTFTATPTTKYSTLHYDAKVQAALGAMQVKGRNLLKNGQMKVWQDGDTGIVGSGHIIDYFWHYSQGASIAVQKADTGIAEYPDSMEFTSAAGNTSYKVWGHIFAEDVVLHRLTGKSVSASIRIYSSEARNIDMSLTYQSVAGFFEPSTTISTAVKSLAIGWNTIKLENVTVPVNCETGGLALEIKATNFITGTMKMAGAQIEIGALATEPEQTTFDEDLKECQRVHEKSYEYGTPGGTATEIGATYTVAARAISGTENIIQIPYKVEKISPVSPYPWSTSGQASRIRNVTLLADVPAAAENILVDKRSGIIKANNTAIADSTEIKVQWSARVDLSIINI